MTPNITAPVYHDFDSDHLVKYQHAGTIEAYEPAILRPENQYPTCDTLWEGFVY